ncbi:MAG: HupE/UreJ family protein, partial [Sneathiella sp.]
LIGFSIMFMAVAGLAKRAPLPGKTALIATSLFVISIWGVSQFSPINLSLPVFVALTAFIFLEFKRLSYGKGDGWINSCIVTLLFSLAHGAGFAGGLIEAGFQETALLYSILFFNLGVEAGQIFIISVIFFSLYIVGKVTTRQLYGRSELAIAIALIWAGSYYFFGRIL